MTRLTLVATAALALTGCASMMEKAATESLTDLAELYETENEEAILAGIAEGSTRTLPNGVVLTGEELDAYTVSILENNENIQIEMVTMAASGDVIFVEYTFAADAVGASQYGPDMTGHSFVNHAVMVLEIEDREVVAVRDYWDNAAYAAPAGYELVLPAPPAPEPEPEVETDEAAGEEGAEGAEGEEAEAAE